MFFLQSQSRKYSPIHSQNSIDSEKSPNRINIEPENNNTLSNFILNSSNTSPSNQPLTISSPNSMFCYLCNKKFIRERSRSSVIAFKKKRKSINSFRCLNCGNNTCLECGYNDVNFRKV